MLEICSARSRRRQSAAFLSVLVLSLAAPLSVSAQDHGIESYVGTWHWIGGDGEMQALRSAVERVTAEMNFLIRGIARNRLVAGQTPEGNLQFEQRGAGLRVAVEGAFEAIGPLDGTAFEATNASGDDVQITQRLEPDALVRVVHFSSDGTGKRHVRYVLSADGNRLTEVSRLEVDLLPKALEVEFTYERM